MSAPAPDPEKTLSTFKFKRNAKFLKDAVSAGVNVELPKDKAMLAVAAGGPFPRAQFTLGSLKVSAEGGRDLTFLSGRGTVAFKASAGASAGIGVYPNPEPLIAALNLDENLPGGLALPADETGHYTAFQWGYDVQASVQGAVALGGAGTATLGVEGNRDAAYAVIRRFEDGRQSGFDEVGAVVNSWVMPSQVRSVSDLDPGTWIIAEVEGGIAAKIGVKYGADFNWVREAKLGGFTGDIGLRLNLGVSAALGFEASGRYAMVISRESPAAADKKLRLRLFKLSKRGWNFAFHMNAEMQALADIPENADDFIQAVFGMESSQILRSLQRVEEWTSEEKLKDIPGLLSGAGVDSAMAFLQQVTGIDPRAEFNKAQGRVAAAVEAFNSLDQRVAAVIQRFIESKVDLSGMRETARLVAEGDREAFRAFLKKQAGRIQLPDNPVFNLLESLAPRGVLSLLDSNANFELAQSLAKPLERLLDGSVIESVFTDLLLWTKKTFHLEVLDTIAEADFDRMDGFLKARLAEFLGKAVGDLNFDDVKKTAAAVHGLIGRKQEFYSKARKILNDQYKANISATWQRTTTNTAMVDVEFDFAHDDALLSGLLHQAIDGDLDTLMVNPPAGVTLGLAALSHAVHRQAAVEINLPYFSRAVDHVNDSFASVKVTAEDGRILAYTAEGTDTLTENRGRRVSTLAVTAALDVPLEGVRVFQKKEFTYNYRHRAAARNITVEGLRHQLTPWVGAYFANQFAPPAGSFATWLMVLDAAVEEKLHNGTNNFGNVLLTLDVSAPAEAVARWMTPSADDKEENRRLDAMSCAIQTGMRQSISRLWFSDVSKYDLGVPASSMIVYSALPLVTQDDHYIDQSDEGMRDGFVKKAKTEQKMTEVAQMLRSLGEEGRAKNFTPDKINIDRVVRDATEDSMSHMFSLMFCERKVIDGAVKARKEMLKFMKQQQKPSEAIRALTKFCAEVTETFNTRLKSLFNGEQLRPLGTQLFLEAGAALAGGEPLKTTGSLAVQVLAPSVKIPPEELTPGDVILEERLLSL
ncbi:MAG: hypothetical protein FJW40_00365 [Acidobacteria bacterium]|nr:hypothetical protein [Acidobacteriota bacterium]